jgi:hypothetical protein
MEEQIYTTQEQVMETLDNVSNEKLLEMVVEKLVYEPIKDILVKPLEPIMIDREVNVPFKSEELDEDGEPIMEMRKEIQQVPSIFRKGIVLALPIDSAYCKEINVGDTIVFNGKFNSVEFDLFKDSMLVKPFDVLFKVKA